MAHANNPAAEWQPVTWLGEKALVSVSHGWKAVVSLERGRLMLFGPADRNFNLLLAPTNRDNTNIWGGHRAWFGPQATWSKIWPPPKEWELSGPESFTTTDGVLRMQMPDAGDGWPQLTRSYHWEGTRLFCRVEMSGGTREAQIVQIFQTPVATVVTVQAGPAKDYPAGYVLLPSVAVSRFTADFPQPSHVTRAGNKLTLQHDSAINKLGFRPQTLTGTAGGFSLTVGRGAQTGKVVAAPDEGFFTQVYLGGHEQVTELEQLSPLFAAGQTASAEVILEGRKQSG